METITLPTLYSITKLNKVKQWTISTAPDQQSSIIRSVSGFTDGVLTTFETVIVKGKNLGKKNETTHYSQALHEMQGKWNKKLDQGYSENSNPKNVTNNTKGPILPMLALDYTKRAHDIIFPSFCQPKLDGVRAITYNKGIYSRKGKQFLGLAHILNEIEHLSEFHLDGELYSKDLTFQEIVGIVKKQKLNEKDIKIILNIKFIVYDLVSDDDYKIRLDTLKKLFKENNFNHIKLIHTDIIKNSSEIEEFHNKYVSQGNEGLIIRNFLGPYEQKNRSKNLQKFKKFIDSEFEIIDFTSGEGVEKDLVLWICRLPQNPEKTFTVRPKGSHLERKKLFKNAKKYIGKYLTVKYFEMTDDGIPRFPVGLSFRDYE